MFPWEVDVNEYSVGDKVWYYARTNTQTLFDLPQRPQLVEIVEVKSTDTSLKMYSIRYINYDFKKYVTGDWCFYSAKHEAVDVFVQDLNNKQKTLETQLRIIKDMLLHAV